MRREDYLRCVAEAAYNVGYGAKKHFATYDIVSKTPGIIGFISTAIGIFSLFIDELSAKHLSAILILLGIVALHMGYYDHQKDSYAKTGAYLTELFNRLKSIYFSAKTADPFDSDKFKKDLEDIERDFSASGISKQILFSDWYAHYKFFWQQQIGWIEEQRKFRFFRDKIPLSFSLVMILVLSAVIIALLYPRVLGVIG